MPGNPPTYALTTVINTTTVDITAYCLKLDIDTSAGTFDRQLSAGVMSVILDNDDGRYSPANSASPHYPYFRPGAVVQLTATHSTVAYPMFYGRIKAITVNPALGNKVITAICEDEIARVLDSDVAISLTASTNPGSMFTSVLTQTNVASFYVDAFSDNVPYAYFPARKAGTMLNQLIREGAYWVYSDPSGTVKCRHRYFQYDGAVVASYNEMYDLYYSVNARNAHNHVYVSGQSRLVAQQQPVTDIRSGAIYVPPLGQTTFWVDYIDPLSKERNTPVMSMVTPVASTDYKFTTASAGTDITSAGTVSATIFATAAKVTASNSSSTDGCYLQFQLRGTPLVKQAPIVRESSVSSSQTQYGKQALIVENTILTQETFLSNFSDYLTTRYKDPVPAIKLAQKNVWPDSLDIELGDLINIQNTNLGLSDRWTVLSVRHSVNMMNGLEHVVDYEMEPFKSPLFVAAGAPTGTNSYIVTSPDGITWHSRSNPKDFFLYGIAWNGSIFCAVGAADGTDAYIITSPDGITWTERSNPKGVLLYEVAWSGSLFCAVGAADGTDAYIVTSSDGITWTERSNPKNKDLYGIAWNGSIFCAVGLQDGTDAYIVTSPDGITWTEQSNPKNVMLYGGITWSGSLFCAVGDPDGTDAYIITSPDGTTWTERSNPKNIALYGIAWNGSIFCAVGLGDGADCYIVTSPDGITWTERSNPKNSVLYAITAAGTAFCAVGINDVTDAYMITSPDGITWTEQRNPKSASLSCITYHP